MRKTPKWKCALISCIICHHKGRRLIFGAIEALLKSHDVEFEIIVATSDKTLLEIPGAKVVYIPGGPAHKRNVAMRFAQGEYLAFFDDDTQAEPYALFYMLQELKKEKIGMVFGKLLNMEFRDRFDEAGSFLTSTGFLWARAESGCLDRGQFDKVEEVLSGKSASCMIHRKLFWEIGGFDASYEILGEETDLAWRVWLYGYQVLFVPNSVTFHAFNTKFKPVDYYTAQRVYLNGCRNYLTMLMTNLSYQNLIFPIVTQSVVWLLAAVGMLITGKFEAGANILKGFWQFVTRLDIIFIKRRKVQGARKISDKKLFKFILRNPPLSYYVKRFFHYIYTGRHG